MTDMFAGFDLSLRSSGVAMPDGTCFTIKGLPTSHTEQQRLAYLYRQFVEVLRDVPADAGIAKESPFVGRMGPGVSTLLAVHGVFAAACETVRPGEPIWEIGATTLKKVATGDGRAKKPEMIAAAQALGYEGEQDDEADAYLVRAWAEGCLDSEPEAL